MPRRVQASISIWGYAALADEPQLGQALEQGRADLRALAVQHENLGVAQPLAQRVDILDMVGPQRDIVSGELGEARQRADRIEIIVENGDLHGALLRPTEPRVRSKHYRAGTISLATGASAGDGQLMSWVTVWAVASE